MHIVILVLSLLILPTIGYYVYGVKGVLIGIIFALGIGLWAWLKLVYGYEPSEKEKETGKR